MRLFLLLLALFLLACPPAESHVGEGGHGSATGEGSAAPGGAGGDAGP